MAKITVIPPALLVDLTVESGVPLDKSETGLTAMGTYAYKYAELMQLAEWVKFAEENGCPQLVNSKPDMNNLSQDELYVFARHPEMSNCRYAIQKITNSERLLDTAEWHADKNSPEMIYTAIAENHANTPEALSAIWSAGNFPIRSKVKALRDPALPAEIAVKLAFSGKPLSAANMELIQALTQSITKRELDDKRYIINALLAAIMAEDTPHYSYSAVTAVKNNIAALPVETIRELVTHPLTALRYAAIESLHISGNISETDLINYCSAYKAGETVAIKTLALYPNIVTLPVINSMLEKEGRSALLFELKIIHPETPEEELKNYFKEMDAAGRLGFVEDYGCINPAINLLAWKDRSTKVKFAAQSNAVYKYPVEFWNMLNGKNKNLALVSANVETIKKIYNMCVNGGVSARSDLVSALTTAFEGSSRDGLEMIEIIEMIKTVNDYETVINLSNKIIGTLDYITYRSNSDDALLYFARYDDPRVRAAIPVEVDEPPIEVIRVLASDPDPTVAAAASALVVSAAIC